MQLKILVLIFSIYTFLSTDLYGACTPQCVAYAREKSKIYTNRVGAHRGAIDWFKIAEKSGKTSPAITAGAIGLPLVLPPQPSINRRYGHVIFVESAQKISDSKLLLSFSHTNYDGLCSFEEATAEYHAKLNSILITSGHLKARKYKVSGFITK